MSAAGSNRGGAAPSRLLRSRHYKPEHHEDIFALFFLSIEWDLRRHFGDCPVLMQLLLCTRLPRLTRMGFFTWAHT